MADFKVNKNNLEKDKGRFEPEKQERAKSENSNKNKTDFDFSEKVVQKSPDTDYKITNNEIIEPVSSENSAKNPKKQENIRLHSKEQMKLEKATSKLNKIENRRLQRKEFNIFFERSQSKKGKFHTKANIVLVKRDNTSFRKAGVLHHVDYFIKNNIYGDVPSLTKAIDNWKPKSAVGKTAKFVIKPSHFLAKDIGRTAIDLGLVAETTVIKSAEVVGRTAKEKIAGKFQEASQDDVSRMSIKAVTLLTDGTKGLKNHIQAKSQFKLEKTRYKLQKAEYKVQKKTEFKPKFKAKKAEIKTAKKERKALKKSGKFTKEENYKKEIKQLKIEKKQLKIQKKFKVKKFHNQWRIADLTRPTPLIFKPVGYGVKSMTASLHQKAITADANNDVMKALDKGNHYARQAYRKTIGKATNPKAALQSRNKKKGKLQDKSQKKQTKLNKKKNKLKSKKSLLDSKKKNSIAKQKKAVKTAEKIEKAAVSIISIPLRFFAVFGSGFIFILLILVIVFLLITSIIEAIFGNSGWVMGTYTAQDKYLSQAEEYYTQLAYEFNEKILMVSDEDDWKKGLKKMDADTSEMEDDPDVWLWGSSTKFGYEPVYDFDRFKLWSFLSAYYYDFSKDDKDDVEYWKYNNDVEELLDSLFEEEYEFEYWYDNTSHWEELNPYTIFGGGSGSYGLDATYYTISGDDDYSPKRTIGNSNWTYKIHPVQFPAELNDYMDSDGWLYFKKYNNEYRIVNCNETSKITGNWKLTPYIIPDTRYYVDEAKTVKPFYYKVEDGKYAFTPKNVEYERDYRFWTNDDGTKDEAWFAVTPNNAKQWNNTIDSNKWLVYYTKKYEWVTDCRLYYNVKQKKTFDELIEEKLKAMDNGEERYQMYELFLGTAEDSETTRGNHQTFTNIFGSSTSIQDSIDNGKVYNGYGYDIQAWNTTHCDIAKEGDSHQGIDIICNANTKIYAGMSGTIEEINKDEDYIIIRRDSYNYWYDGDGNGKKRDTEIYYYNINVKSSLEEGDKIKEGDYIGLSSPVKKCESISNAASSDYYIHLKVKIDTNGAGWDFIDPLLVLE